MREKLKAAPHGAAGKEVSNMEELEALARPLAEYLKRNYHPHAVIMVTDERVMVVETVCSVPIHVPD